SSFDYFIEEPEEYEEKESVSPILNTVYSMKKDKYGETTEKLQSRPGYFTGSLQIEPVYDYDEE
ncbi:MAG: hypothetical protein IJT24_07440, partial [Lachnospiraceae bacterium]|nr:hypothetical protein [Lachnospiraceae bacterium]